MGSIALFSAAERQHYEKTVEHLERQLHDLQSLQAETGPVQPILPVADPPSPPQTAPAAFPKPNRPLPDPADPLPNLRISGSKDGWQAFGSA
jgi:hypothetical protein